jgi:hypothetical protein
VGFSSILIINIAAMHGLIGKDNNLLFGEEYLPLLQTNK